MKNENGEMPPLFERMSRIQQLIEKLKHMRDVLDKSIENQDKEEIELM